MWYNEHLFTKKESEKGPRENVARTHTHRTHTHTQRTHTHTHCPGQGVSRYPKVGLDGNRIQEMSLLLQDPYKIMGTMLLLLLL